MIEHTKGFFAPWQLIASVLVLMFVPGELLGQQQSSQTIVTSGGKVSRLGGAYASDKESFVGAECLDGSNFDPIGAAESSFSLDQSLSEKQLADQLGFSVGGRARFGVVEASASADFLQRSTSNAFSVSSIYKAFYYFPAHKLKLTAHKYSPLGDSVEANYERWNQTCGDYYVDQIGLGAKLFISIRVDFSSSDQKRDFEAKFSIAGPMASASADLKTATSQFSKDTKVTISAYQLGGDVSKLTQVFANSEDGRNSYTQCTLGDFGSCAKVLQNALAYAADTNTGFPSQLAQGVTPGPAVLSYVIEPYSAAGIYARNYPFLVEAVKLARMTLSQDFEKTYRQYIAANQLLLTRLEQQRRKDVEAAFEGVKTNLNAILAASKTCYDTPEQCPETVTKHLTLVTVDDKLLLPSDFPALCLRALVLSASDPLRRTITAMVNNMKPGGFDTAKDALDCRVFEAMLQRTKSLSLAAQDLSDLSPLSEFVNVETLDISANKINDLSPIATLSELTVLKASKNKVDNLTPIEYLSQLRNVDFGHNRLMDLKALANLRSLAWIEVEDNHISDISAVSELKELTMLDISHNNIQALDPMKTRYRLKWLLFGDNLAPEENIKAFAQRYAKTCVILETKIELNAPNTATEVWNRRYAGNPEPCAEGPQWQDPF